MTDSDVVHLCVCLCLSVASIYGCTYVCACMAAFVGQRTRKGHMVLLE